MMEKVIIGNATLYRGDCLEILPTLGKVDAVITDPPYIMNYTSGSITNCAKQDAWKGLLVCGDKTAGIQQTHFTEWVFPVYKCLNEQGYIFAFCNDKNICQLGAALDFAGFKQHNMLVWMKPNATPNRWFMKNNEFIWFYRKGISVPIKEMGYKTCNYFEQDRKEHPTQKPVSLLTFLINSIYSQTILDPFMGSGTTGVACMNLDRKFIGIEIDPKYFDIACKRIEQAQQQLKLAL